MKMRLKFSGLLTNEMIYMASDILIKAIAFISLPFFIRKMSTEDYGAFSLYQSYVSILTIFFGFNLQSGIVKYFIDHDGQQKNLFTAVWITLAAGFAEAGILLLANRFWNLFHLSTPVLAVISVTAVLNAILFIGLENLRAMFRAFSYGAVSLSLSLISTVLGLIFVSVKTEQLGQWRLLSVLIATALSACFAVSSIVRRDGLMFRKETAGYLLSYSIPLIPYTLSTTVISQINKMFLAGYGLSEVGIYSFAANMGMIMYVVAVSLNRAYQPYLFLALKEGRPYLNRMYQNVFLFYVIYAAFIFGGELLIFIFGDSSYKKAAGIIPIIVLGYGFFFLYSLIVNYFYYFKKNTVISALSVCSAAAVVIFNAILIPPYGYYGAALAMDLAYLLLFITAYLYVRYKLRITIFKRNSVWIASAMLILPPGLKLAIVWLR